MTRIAIIDADRCKPSKCRQECKKSCPVVRGGSMCIEVRKESKLAIISEDMCIGCGICVKTCPFGAVRIVNLPAGLEKDVVHRYGQNGFILHRLPIPRAGQVLGIIGANGIGKSTILKILGGKIIPNLGVRAPTWHEICLRFRGSELQPYFAKMRIQECKCVIKPQYVDAIASAVVGSVGAYFSQGGEKEKVLEALQLSHLLERQISDLSGGELQRFAIAATCLQDADVYLFDEPSSYLDVRQRMRVAEYIREVASLGKFVVVVEHDLAMLDYLSDYVHVLYGEQTAYGVVSAGYGCHEGINVWLNGFEPTENVRFRDGAITFRTSQEDELTDTRNMYEYPGILQSMHGFTFSAKPGTFSLSQTTVLLGENGTGKTTFVRHLYKVLADFRVSYKPQKIAPKFTGTVRELLHSKISGMYTHPQFVSDVMNPLMIQSIIDNKVQELSGGELQRVAIVLCLGTPAQVYLIDEPSAYLDCEQRVVCARVIKRFILHAHASAFVVEHDLCMATYLADRVLFFRGVPGVEGFVSEPMGKSEGMNSFLKSMDITVRRDAETARPRINKRYSILDAEQREKGMYMAE